MKDLIQTVGLLFVVEILKKKTEKKEKRTEKKTNKKNSENDQSTGHF